MGWSNAGGWATRGWGKAVVVGGGGGSTLTWDNANMGTSMSLSSDFLTVTEAPDAGVQQMILATLPKSSGKRYFEVKVASALNVAQVGVALSGGTFTLSTFMSNNTNTCCVDSRAGGSDACNLAGAAGGPSTTFDWAVNDIIGVAVDITNGKIWFAHNNNWAAWTVGSDPGTATSPVFTFTAGLTLLPAGSTFVGGTDPAEQLVIAGSGTSLNAYSPPTGYSWWNT